MARRLYKWLEVSGWTLAEAYPLGRLVASCNHGDCWHSSTLRLGNVSPDVKLYEIARRMKCRGCARKGGRIEIWSVDALKGTTVSQAARAPRR